MNLRALKTLETSAATLGYYRGPLSANANPISEGEAKGTGSRYTFDDVGIGAREANGDLSLTDRHDYLARGLNRDDDKNL
jgi:hypothetical protein